MVFICSAIRISRSDRFLPKLNQYAMRTTWRDERRLAAVPEVDPVDDAPPVGFELRQQRVEPIHIDRDVMQAFATALEKAGDEARGADFFAELDLVALEQEVRQTKAARVA